MAYADLITFVPGCYCSCSLRKDTSLYHLHSATLIEAYDKAESLKNCKDTSNVECVQ